MGSCRYETSPSTLPELSQQVYEMIIDEVRRPSLVFDLEGDNGMRPAACDFKQLEG